MGPTAAAVEDRQILIRSIDELDRRIAALHPEPPPVSETPRSPETHPCSPLRKTLRELLQEAAAWDQKCLEKAKKLTVEIREEVSTLRRGLRAARQYTQTKEKEIQPRFMDAKH